MNYYKILTYKYPPRKSGYSEKSRLFSEITEHRYYVKLFTAYVPGGVRECSILGFRFFDILFTLLEKKAAYKFGKKCIKNVS